MRIKRSIIANQSKIFHIIFIYLKKYFFKFGYKTCACSHSEATCNIQLALAESLISKTNIKAAHPETRQAAFLIRFIKDLTALLKAIIKAV